MIENKCKNCEYYRNPDYTRCHECKVERNKVGPDEYTKYGMWIGEKDDSCDLISRKDAIKTIEKKAKRIKNKDTLNGLAGAVNVLFELPPVTPAFDVLGEIKAEILFRDKNVKDVRTDGHCFFTAEEIFEIIDERIEERSK